MKERKSASNKSTSLSSRKHENLIVIEILFYYAKQKTHSEKTTDYVSTALSQHKVRDTAAQSHGIVCQTAH